MVQKTASFSVSHPFDYLPSHSTLWAVECLFKTVGGMLSIYSSHQFFVEVSLFFSKVYFGIVRSYRPRGGGLLRLCVSGWDSPPSFTPSVNRSCIWWERRRTWDFRKEKPYPRGIIMKASREPQDCEWSSWLRHLRKIHNRPRWGINPIIPLRAVHILYNWPWFESIPSRRLPCSKSFSLL